MMTFPCPHNGCDYDGPPRKSREILRAKAVWLCESCGGVLPIRVTQRAKRRQRTWAQAATDDWRGY